MTIERPPAPSEAVCTRCAGSLRPGARFCVICGAPIAGGAPAPGPLSAGFRSAPTPAAGFGMNPAVPAPRMPQSGPFGAPPPAHAGRGRPEDADPRAFNASGVTSLAYGTPNPGSQRARTVRIAVIAAALVVVVAAAIGTAVVVVNRTSTPSAQTTTQAAPAPGAVVTASTDPTTQLRAQQQADNAAAESAVGMWMPQLSAKKVGMVADGMRYDAAAVLADHQRLRAQFPGTLLVFSGDYASFKGSDFWVTLAGQTFATAQQANAWCASAGFDADHCYAKRLSHSGGYTGNTVLRN